MIRSRDTPRDVDRYTFAGLRCDVRSHHEGIRAYLRWMHERFLLDGSVHTTPDVTLEISRSDRDEWVLRDDRYRYRRLADGSVQCYELRSGRRVLEAACDPYTLAQCALLQGLAAAAPGWLVHAASLSFGGRGIIFCGTSGRGKTTLALRLAQAGCEFLSDEIAWICDDARTIEPFPRRVNLRHASADLLGFDPTPRAGIRPAGAPADGISLDIEDIVPGSLGGRRPLTAIVLLDGFADTPRIETVSELHAALELARHSVLPIDDATHTLLAFLEIVGHADCYRLTVGDPDLTVERLLSLAGRHRGATVEARA